MNTNELNIQTNRQPKRLKDISEILANNPELPDMVRDAAPYFSPATRQSLLKIAALGEFALKTREVSGAVESQTTSPEMGDFYSTMKKYVPMNRRKSIDMMMSLMNGMRASFKPQTATNGLEEIISTLSSINKVSKMMSATGDIKRLSGILNEKDSSNHSTNNILSLIKGMLKNDSSSGIDGLLSALSKKISG